MSDFFYKERIEPVFSPVITVKRANMSGTVVSAIDSLLCPSGNMFTRAETVRNLMKIEKYNLEETARVLSLKMSDVANKLRLLEFSQKEREAVLKGGFSEASALRFLSLDKGVRLYCIEHCSKKKLDDKDIAEYVLSVADTKKPAAKSRKENVRKLIINDIGFFFNSIENSLRIARTAGFEVDYEKNESDGYFDVHIRVKKKDGE